MSTIKGKCCSPPAPPPPRRIRPLVRLLGGPEGAALYIFCACRPFHVLHCCQSRTAPIAINFSEAVMAPPERFKSELKFEALAEPNSLVVPQVHNIQPAAKCSTRDADWTLAPCQTSRTNPVAAARQNMWPRCYPTHSIRLACVLPAALLVDETQYSASAVARHTACLNCFRRFQCNVSTPACQPKSARPAHTL